MPEFNVLLIRSAQTTNETDVAWFGASRTFAEKIKMRKLLLGGAALCSLSGSALADKYPWGNEEPFITPASTVAATAPPAATSPEQKTAATTTAFAEGRDARTNYEQWFASLPDGSYKDGATFWATNRNVKPTSSCARHIGTVDWHAGCDASNARLATVDFRRKAEKDYWRGWNSLPADTAPSMPASVTASQTPLPFATPKAANRASVATAQDGTPRDSKFQHLMELAGDAGTTDQQADDLAEIVRQNGDRCDTISAATHWVFSVGFTLHCNDLRYEYDIADKGGHWVVTVK